MRAITQVDHRYKRNGKRKANITTKPLTGWEAIEVTERRRTTQWIDRMVELANVHYPDVIRIRVVMDQLNTHKPATSYNFFPLAQGKRILIDPSFNTPRSKEVG